MPPAKRPTDLPFQGFSSPSYTQVPDELFDALMPTLADAELRVLFYIIRRTFGFKRDADAISLSQMVSGITTRDGRVLDHGTGLSKATVARGLKGLRDKGIIIAQRHSSAERGNEATSYRLHFKTEPPTLTPPLSHNQDTVHPAPRVSPARQAVSQPQDTQHTARKKTAIEYSKAGSLREESGAEQKSEDRYQWSQLDQIDSSSEMKDLGSLLPHRVRRDASGEDRKAIAAAIERFSSQLGDQADVKVSVSRAINLFQASGVSRDGFVDVLYEAKGEVQDRRNFPGKAPVPRNQMAYFFAVVEDRLGLRQVA
jgi:hypothetical protein